MAVKPPDLLNRLPSVAELLDKPPIRALAERWNRSVVAGGVKSFLDELKSDFQRRAAEFSLPSIRDLAERAARFVVSQQQHALGIAINATGRIWDSTWAAPPIADSALERAIATGREFVFDSRSPNGNLPQIETLLCRLAGAPAAAVVHSYAGALYLALATLAADREVLIARAEVADLGRTDSLPKLARAAHAILTEVGTTNSAVAADYEAVSSDRTAAILKLNPDTYRIIGQTAAAELDELVAFARDQEFALIDALGIAPLVDLPPAITSMPRSARASIAAGVDLVLLRGDGLVGGPPCGILLGSNEIINRIAAHPLFAAWRIDLPRSAALAATLECYTNPTGGIDSIPVWQCLSVSLENLRNRAERIAPNWPRPTESRRPWRLKQEAPSPKPIRKACPHSASRFHRPTAISTRSTCSCGPRTSQFSAASKKIG